MIPENFTLSSRISCSIRLSYCTSSGLCLFWYPMHIKNRSYPEKVVICRTPVLRNWSSSWELHQKCYHTILDLEYDTSFPSAKLKMRYTLNYRCVSLRIKFAENIHDHCMLLGWLHTKLYKTSLYKVVCRIILWVLVNMKVKFYNLPTWIKNMTVELP